MYFYCGSKTCLRGNNKWLDYTPKIRSRDLTITVKQPVSIRVQLLITKLVLTNKKIYGSSVENASILYLRRRYTTILVTPLVIILTTHIYLKKLYLLIFLNSFVRVPDFTEKEDHDKENPSSPFFSRL